MQQLECPPNGHVLYTISLPMNCNENALYCINIDSPFTGSRNVLSRLQAEERSGIYWYLLLEVSLMSERRRNTGLSFRFRSQIEFTECMEIQIYGTGPLGILNM
jgi:hypothetical protein